MNKRRVLVASGVSSSVRSYISRPYTSLVSRQLLHRVCLCVCVQVARFEKAGYYENNWYIKEVAQVWLGHDEKDKYRPNMLILQAMMINPISDVNIFNLLREFMSWGRNAQNTMHSAMLAMPLSRTPELMTADLYDGDITVHTWFQHLQTDPCTKDVYHPTLVDSWIPSLKRFRYNNNIYPPKERYIEGCNLLIGYR